MKKRCKILLLVLSLCLYLWGLYFLGNVKEETKIVHVFLRQEIPASRAEEIFRREGEEENAVPSCFWGQSGKETVICRETEDAVSAQLVLMAGNPELLGAGALNWQTGCLVDTKTAQALFGTADCGGQILRQGETGYPVLGVVSALQPTVVRLAQKGEALDRCAVFGTKSQAENFLVRWGLQGEILDFFPFWAITADVSLLLPGILLAALCIFLGRDWRTLRISDLRKQGPLLLRFVSTLALGVGGVVLLGKCLVIPEEMIPSRWSDFSFWGSWWQTQKENFLTIAFTPLGSRQLQMVLNMIKSIGCTLVSAVVVLWVLTKKENVRRQDHADLAD